MPIAGSAPRRSVSGPDSNSFHAGETVRALGEELGLGVQVARVVPDLGDPLVLMRKTETCRSLSGVVPSTFESTSRMQPVHLQLIGVDRSKFGT